MYKLCAALLFAGATLAGPVAEPTHHRGYETKCHIVYDVAHSQKCNTYHEEVCHEEYDVIVDTTYIEECADIVTKHCSETHQEVHHSSAVVGHDTKVGPAEVVAHAAVAPAVAVAPAAPVVAGYAGYGIRGYAGW